jgi:hypothetical protein
MTTPVAFIIFNRPDTTEKVFAEIRRARPPRLYLIADGPRTPEEKALTDASRAIAEQVDWRCDVVKLYSEENLGCRRRVISGLDAVFAQEEQAIILEDDCLPDPSFFTFCETLLHRYCNEESVMHISGNNFQQGKWVGDGDYYFSRYSHIWGWATWKRAWANFSDYIVLDTDFFEHHIETLFGSDITEVAYWQMMSARVNRPGYSAWSFHWQFAIWKSGGKCILPNKTLVENIGFGAFATHTKGKPAHCVGVRLESLETCHPPENMTLEMEADRRSFYHIFYTPPKKYSLWQKVKLKVKHMLKTLDYQTVSISPQK